MRDTFQPSFYLKVARSTIFFLISKAYIPATVASLCLLSTQVIASSNLWEEDRIAQDISNAVPEDEIIWLDSGAHQPVLGLYKEATTSKIKGAALILHDFGHHPNWPQVVEPLRYGLPESGWHTLSIQMPIPDSLWQFTRPADIYTESVKRIEAAVQFLQQKDIKSLVLIAHGASAALATKYLSETNTPFSAFVAISINHDEMADDWRNIATTMKSLKLAMLDIYAEHDKKSVTDNVELRLIAARSFAANLQDSPPISYSKKVRQLAKNKTNNLWFRQIKIISADANFPDHRTVLVKHIRGWLRHYGATN